MALYSTRTYQWQDLADESVAEDYLVTDYVASDYFSTTAPLGWEEWTEWTGNGVTIDGSTGFDDLVYTGDTQDLGVERTFYFTATALSNGTHSIAIQKSADGSTGWTTQSLGAITARYIRFVVTVVNASATARLDSFSAELFFDPIIETFNSFSVGATNTSLPIARNYSSIVGMSYDAPQNFQVVLSDTTASDPKVISYDLDTWGKVATSTTANITLRGFPQMAADSNGNIIVS